MPNTFQAVHTVYQHRTVLIFSFVQRLFLFLLHNLKTYHVEQIHMVEEATNKWTTTTLSPTSITHHTLSANSEVRTALESITQTDMAVEIEPSQLSAVREDVYKIREPQAALISPLDRIPNELLGEIMKHCLLDHDGSRRQPEHHQYAAFVLASVCSRWRSTAIAIPQLWTSMVFYRWNVEVSLPLTQLLLSRAGNCDLELHIRSDKAPYEVELLDVIRPYLHRMSCILDWVSSLSLAYEVVHSPDLGRLRVLKLETGYQTTTLLMILQICPRLEEAKIRIDDHGLGVPCSPPQIVTMSRLYRLHLSYGTDPSNLIDFLVTRSLVIFHTQDVNIGIPWPQRHFVQFLTRSLQSLKTLGLAYSAERSGGQICDLLDAVPNLEELHIHEWVVTTDAIYRHLTTATGGLPKVPHLRTLVIRGDEITLAPDQLYAMILSRAIDCPLKKVCLCSGLMAMMREDASFRKLWGSGGRLGYTLEANFQTEYTSIYLDSAW